MLNSPIIDIAIGLALVYLLLSLIVTAVTGYVAQLMSLRAKKLEKGLQNMLGELKNGKDVTELLYQAPLIKPSVNPKKVKGNKPNWIDTSMFVPALVQAIHRADKAEDALAVVEEEAHDIDRLIQLTKGSTIGENIVTLYERAKREVGDKVEDATNVYVRFEENLEQWFDSSMEDVSDWYTGHVKWITFGIAILVAAAFNADSIRIAETIYDGKVKLPAMTKFAEEYAQVAAEGARGQQNWQTISRELPSSQDDPFQSEMDSQEGVLLQSGYSVYDQAEQREAIQSEVEVLLGGLRASDIPIGWDGTDLQTFQGWQRNLGSWFGASIGNDEAESEKVTLLLKVFTEIIEGKKREIYGEKAEAKARLERIKKGRENKLYDAASPQLVGQVESSLQKLTALVGPDGDSGDLARIEGLLLDAELQLEEAKAKVSADVSEEETRKSFEKLLKIARLEKLSESERYQLGTEALERVRLNEPEYLQSSIEDMEKEIEFLLIDAKKKYPELVELGRRYFLPQYFKVSSISQMLLGWLVTAFALTLGAPFWFGMLKKVVRIRENQKKQRGMPSAA